MKCGYCKNVIKIELNFKTLFQKQDNRFCEECKQFLGIYHNLVLDKYNHYYFANYDHIKEDIYNIKYFGDVEIASKYKLLFSEFFKKRKFDLVTIAPTNKIREAIRGFNQVAIICELCNVNYTDIFFTHYREKQAKLHKERTEHQVFVRDSEVERIKSAKKILIIDDIFTSGKTLVSLATELKSINSDVLIEFLTLAKTNLKQY